MSKRISILDVPVDCVTMDEVVTRIEGFLSAGTRSSVLAVTPDKVISAQTDARLKRALDDAALLLPDGIGIVLAARFLGLHTMVQVAGCDLMPRLCELAERKRLSIFLFGATSESNQLASAALREKFPDLKIAGQQHGYIDKDDMQKLIYHINDSGADIMFIALGSPRQEYWVANYLDQTNVRLCQGVGGTFDVLAGRKKRAPPLFHKMYLEWLYMFMVRPSIWPRVRRSLVFAFRIVLEKLRNRRQPESEET